MRTRNKLNVKQAASLTRVGVHSDGGGLYLRVRESGSRSWLFVYSFGGKRREMGLGSDLDVSLATARDKAASARAQVIEGVDPQLDGVRRRAPAKPVVTFGTFALQWLDDIEGGFRNAKHQQQWRNTLTTYAGPLFDTSITEVTTEVVLS